jgi:hypothetical protein
MIFLDENDALRSLHPFSKPKPLLMTVTLVYTLCLACLLYLKKTWAGGPQNYIK